MAKNSLVPNVKLNDGTEVRTPCAVRVVARVLIETRRSRVLRLGREASSSTRCVVLGYNINPLIECHRAGRYSVCLERA